MQIIMNYARGEDQMYALDPSIPPVRTDLAAVFAAASAASAGIATLATPV